VQYRIVSIVFPHGHIVPSLKPSHDIHLFPINNPSLDTGTAVACQKITANEVANSCHCNNTSLYNYIKNNQRIECLVFCLS